MTDVLPVLGLSAAATFLSCYQRTLMLFGLAMNVASIFGMWTLQLSGTIFPELCVA